MLGRRAGNVNAPRSPHIYAPDLLPFQSIVAYLDPLLEEQESKSKLQFINKELILLSFMKCFIFTSVFGAVL